MEGDGNSRTEGNKTKVAFFSDRKDREEIKNYKNGKQKINSYDLHCSKQ